MAAVTKAPRLSAPQRAVMEALADGELASAGDVVERIGVTPTRAERLAVARALEGLAARGLIDKRVPVLAGLGWQWRVRRRS